MRTPIRSRRNAALRERTASMAWDDLRTVLAVTRAGSLSGAARALDVEHSTVFRRVDELERRLGVRLFERTRNGYAATSEGEAVADAARVMEEAALAAERRVLGADLRLEGVVRVATSEMLACFLLPGLLKGFLAEHPGIELEIDVANRPVDLARREADLALRATNTPPDGVVGRQLAELTYAVFAHPSLVGKGTPALGDLPWLGFDDRSSGFEVAKWMRENWPHVQVRARFDSLITMMVSASRALGVAVLPTFAAGQQPELVRITPPLERPRMGLWLLSHPDVRDNARVRALSRHLAETVPPELARLAAAAPRCPKLAQACDAKRAGKGRKKR